MGGCARRPGSRTAGCIQLLEQVRTALRTRHYSLRTEATYLSWIKRFILFHGKRHPRDMGAQEVHQFLSHLAVEGQGLDAKSGLKRHPFSVSAGAPARHRLAARRGACETPP